MRTMMASAVLALSLVACSEESGPGTTGGDGGGAGAGDGGGTPAGDRGTALSVTVPDEGRVFITLDPPAVVTGDGLASTTKWDLAFEGLDVYTNSGPSGPGQGAGFGPLTALDILGTTIPDVPFLKQDATGGAFLEWYFYDGTTHALWSRYHVYGVKSGGDLFKVQVLSYYGEAEGAAVSALYQVRYAKVGASGIGATQTLADLDATAGGLSAPESAPSGCVKLATGALLSLTPADAAASMAWDLCFRRDKISVNGGLSGPGGVTAVDLNAGDVATETLDGVMAETAQSEQGRFDAAGYAALTKKGLAYHADRIVSIFSDEWIDGSKSPIAPAGASWLVLGADGQTHSLVVFDSFDQATDKSPGTVALHVKAVH